MSIKPKNSRSNGFLLIEFVVALAVMTIFFEATGRMMSLVARTYAMGMGRLRLLSVARGQPIHDEKMLRKTPVDLQIELRGVTGDSCERAVMSLVCVSYGDESAGILGECDG